MSVVNSYKIKTTVFWSANCSVPLQHRAGVHHQSSRVNKKTSVPLLSVSCWRNRWCSTKMLSNNGYYAVVYMYLCNGQWSCGSNFSKSPSMHNHSMTIIRVAKMTRQRELEKHTSVTHGLFSVDKVLSKCNNSIKKPWKEMFYDTLIKVQENIRKLPLTRFCKIYTVLASRNSNWEEISIAMSTNVKNQIIGLQYRWHEVSNTLRGVIRPVYVIF